tara:strand:+ start:15185 stop:18547 length:3363 start_codon:yes stop_codon:yes gene_type:complete
VKRSKTLKQINKQEIREQLGNTFYQRGDSYLGEGRVGDLEIIDNDEDVSISAQVKGSGKYHYTVTVEIDWYDDEAEIEGYCSCPIAYQCKHVAAVCLKYATLTRVAKKSLQGKSSEQVCFDWLDALALQNKNSQTTEHREQFIAFLLQATRDEGILTVQFIVTYPLKSGKGLAKGRPINYYDFTDNYYTQPTYVSEADSKIGILLKSCLGQWRDLLLKDEQGYLALQKMIETGRAFWESVKSEPLKLGSSRQLASEWILDKKSNYSLKLGIKPEATLLLTEPPLYLDLENNALGKIDSTLSLSQLTTLLKAPPIPKAIQDKIGRQLLNNFPDLPIAPLIQLETEEMLGVTPVPKVLAFGKELSNGRLRYCLRLRFAYQDIQVKVSNPLIASETLPSTKSMIEHDGKLWSIARDLGYEGECISRLQALNFAPMPDDSSELVLCADGSSASAYWTPEEISAWQYFIEEALPQLEAQAWHIELDPSFKLQFIASEENWHAEIQAETNTGTQADTEDDQNDWFSLRFDLPVFGNDPQCEEQQKVALLPLISELLSRYQDQQLPEKLLLPLDEHRFIPIPRERIQPILDILYELYDRESLDEDSLRLSRHDAARLSELDKCSASPLRWQGGEMLRELGEKLNDFKGILPVKAPVGLNATLRNYQQEGLNWLQFLRDYQFGGILADDMGLGKTVQTLAHLLLEKEQGRMTKPCLIIAPTSLMGNWRREAAQFAPDLKVLVLHGTDRKAKFEQIDVHDVILTTYPLLLRDGEILSKQAFHYLVLDEAQVIKNAKAKSAKVVRSLKTRHRLCLTGTPMENHLGELWSLFDFLMPGFLRDQTYFKQFFRTPIEKHHDDTRREQLSRRVKPFMLRRTKQEVATELPKKTEIIRSVTLESPQAALYESIRLSMEKKVQQAIARKGLARSHITILDALLKLRQTCCDPQLLSLEQAGKVKASAKLELLMSILPEMVEEGRKVLLFSQFTKMLSLIEAKLQEEQISYSKLTGQTKNRDQAIDAFRYGDAKVFLISLKAGGVGLNLTEADTVIHYDPWWNPAAENQATDRAYRIGQDKPVFVYKLITENTVEEKILAMQKRKRALAEGVYSGKKTDQESALSADDLKELLAPIG